MLYVLCLGGSGSRHGGCFLVACGGGEQERLGGHRQVNGRLQYSCVLLNDRDTF